MLNEQEGDFRFFVPIAIEKGGDGKDDVREVFGVASTEDLDLDQEVVSASGLKKSLDYFLRHGRIDYDHLSKAQPKYIIGEPLSAHFDEKNRFHLRGRLYKGQEIADQVWGLLKAGCTRLGWSVGGKVLKKALQFDKGLSKFVPRVTEALINHVAITPHPKNVNTFATASAYGAFMKSLATGTTLGTIVNLGGRDFIIADREEFEKAVATTGGGPAGGTTPLGTNPVIPQSLESDIKVFKRFIRSKDFSHDANASRRWFKSQGIKPEMADAFAAYIAKNHGRIAAVKRGT
jgi:hypothetical protein